MKKMLRVTLPGVVLVLAMALGAWSAPFVNAGSSSTATPKASSTSSSSSSSSSSATPKASATSSGSSQSGFTTPKYSSEQSNEKGASKAPTSVDPAALVKGANVSSSSSMTLGGSFSSVSGLQDRINAVGSFNFDMTGFNNEFSSISSSEYDKQFVEDSLTSNAAELWTMEHSVKLVKDADLRNLIMMMIQMHAKDMQTILQIAPKFGIDTSSVDFTNASVYPETPDYDLGMRTQNLTEQYLDHVAESSAKYDDVVMHVLDSEHASDVQSELAAERLVQSQALKAFAKHSADVTELHLSLIDMVSERASLHLDEVPAPNFSSSYMSPAQITVNGKSGQGQASATPSPVGTSQPGATSSPSATNQSGSGSSTSSSSGSH